MKPGVFTCLFVAVALAVGSFAPRAQEVAKPDEPLMGSESSPGVDLVGRAVAVAQGADITGRFGGADNLYRILVVGDGLAGGFGAGVTRMLEGDGRFEIVNRFNEASGLARPEIYDWAQAAPKILITKEFDAALVHVGVNDRQALRDAAGQQDFKTAAWEASYRKQIGGLLDLLKTMNIRVYWVAIPPMGDTAFDQDMQYLNSLYRAEVGMRGGVFIDLRSKLTAGDGTYLDRGPDETGVERKLRARDGITFLKQGNNRMGQLIVAAIKAELANTNVTQVATAEPGVPAAQAEPVSVATRPDPGLPQFGQQGLDGEDIAFVPSPDSQTAQVAEAPANSVQPASTRKAVLAASGSAAEALFSQGISPGSQPGRFDDFGIVAAP